MRSLRVVVLAPYFDDDARFLQAEEEFAVQEFIAQLAVERFTASILPWTARLDVQRFGTDAVQPVAHYFRRHFGTIVGTNVLRDAVGQHHVGQRLDAHRCSESTPPPPALATPTPACGRDDAEQCCLPENAHEFVPTVHRSIAACLQL